MIIGLLLLIVLTMSQQERQDLTAVWEQRESDLLPGSPPSQWQKENENLKLKFFYGILEGDLGDKKDPGREIWDTKEGPLQLIVRYAMGHSECTAYRNEMDGIGYKTSAAFALELDEVTVCG